ncbi:MAG: inositol monophosphatase [Alphaproteobacteria bacterium]
MRPDINAVEAIVRDVAATEIMPRFGTLKAHEIRVKTHAADFVTDADIHAELQLTRRLTELLPGSVAVGEEAVHHDRAILDRLSDEAPVWVLDPVDGTGNFAHGRDSFGVIVALVYRHHTVLGLLHDPVRDITVMGEEGGGAWSGGGRLTVERPETLAELTGSLGNKTLRAVEGRVGGIIRLASACQDYMALLLGRSHFSFYRHLMPWDHAAGVLLHAEAGGYSAMIDGTPYRPVETDSGILLAPDRESWTQLRALVATSADPI